MQGYEFHVLSGAQRIIRANPRIVILMEYWPYGLKQAGVDPANLVSIVVDLGLAFFDLTLKEIPHGALLRMSNRNDDAYCNYFLFHRNMKRD